MSTQTFNITNAQQNTPASGPPTLVVLITPQPTTVNGTSVSSPYVMPYTITSPSAAQLAKYVPGGSTYTGTITLTSDT